AFDGDVEVGIDAEGVLEIDRAADDAIVDFLEANGSAFIQRDETEDDGIRECAVDVDVGAAGDVRDVVAYGECVRRREMQPQIDAILPRGGDDGRDAAARQEHIDERLIEIEVLEVERAVHRDFALQHHAVRAAGERDVEVRLDGEALEVADRDIRPLQRDPHVLRLEAFDRQEAAGEDRSASQRRAQLLDVDPIAEEGEAAIDVVDDLRESGEPELSVLNFRASRHARIAHGPGDRRGDGDLPFGPQPTNKE